MFLLLIFRYFLKRNVHLWFKINFSVRDSEVRDGLIGPYQPAPINRSLSIGPYQLVPINGPYQSVPINRSLSTGPYQSQTSKGLLTPRSTVLLEKITDPQPVKKFPAFYVIRRFITALTSACHLSLS